MQSKLYTKTYGALLGQKHSTEYGLKMTGCSITYPEPNRIQRKVPYGPVLDFTEALLEDVPYQQRTLEMTFDYTGGYLDFEQAMQELANDIHGQRIEIVLDFDPWYCYAGVPSVSRVKENKVDADVTITVTADPYKLERFGSTGKWLWDALPFDGGVIRNYVDIPVNVVTDIVDCMSLQAGFAHGITAATRVVIPGSRKLVAPKIFSNEADFVAVAWWGSNQEAVPGTPAKKFTIFSGLTWLPDMMIGSGENHLYLMAIRIDSIPGTTVPVTIDFRGGIL